MSQVPYKLEISRKKQKQNTKKQTKRDFIWAFPYKNEPKCLTALVLRPTVSAEKQDFKDFIWESYCKVEKNLIGKGPHTHSGKIAIAPKDPLHFHMGHRTTNRQAGPRVCITWPTLNGGCPAVVRGEAARGQGEHMGHRTTNGQAGARGCITWAVREGGCPAWGRGGQDFHQNAHFCEKTRIFSTKTLVFARCTRFFSYKSMTFSPS